MSPQALTTPLGTFGVPPDAAAWAALILGALLGVLAALRPRVLERAARSATKHPRGALGALALGAGALSAAYVAFYLRGGPRIIDATSYWLEARSFAAGSFGFALPASEASFSGRFILPTSELRAATIFPPGYPLALAPFQLLDVPMWLGPLLGVACVGLTYACAARLFPDNPRVAWWAALLSTLSAALRYHTADTMSHGWCAVLWLAVVYCALRARDAQGGAARVATWLAGSGLCLGWLLATRPFSAIAAALSLGLLWWMPGARPRPAQSRSGWVLAPVVLGLLPGAALWLWHQAATSGALFGSSQLAYYALADGPPGCFGYGPGARGCLFEHGDFVRSQMPHGFGAWQMLATTGRRLKAHLVDAGNLELFALAVPWIAWRGRRSAAMRFLAGALVLQVLVYAPFYFDGNYPGGGARFYIDALPLEHILLGWFISSWRLRAWVPSVSLLGFALHSAYDHHSLMEREGGQPMFPSSAEVRAHVGGAAQGARVVFVDTDHGFNLGFDPGALAAWRAGAKGQVFVARRTYDSREGLLLQALSATGWFYDFNPHGNKPASWSAWSPPPQTRGIVLEAESDWPPREVQGGWVHPDWPPGSCVSQRQGLRFRAAPTHPRPRELEGQAATQASLELVAAEPGEYRVTTVWARMANAEPGVVLLRVGEQRHQASLAFAAGTCRRVVLPRVRLTTRGDPAEIPRATLQVSVTQADFVLDRVILEAL